ncbi:hypothetical protein N7510_011246 [Penicillium lagena]|uniref:uncharacterized protein n=1 Tax=Penicillium lagena TaxID=94218 RepID=UPI002540551E|nr:uncharacterized protein N7510_011246 [Penicillium lagena]KAJ5601712.1 hypothetical protein N7510_011246 [Penicillium lagena]
MGTGGGGGNEGLHRQASHAFAGLMLVQSFPFSQPSSQAECQQSVLQHALIDAQTDTGHGKRGGRRAASPVTPLVDPQTSTTLTIGRRRNSPHLSVSAAAAFIRLIYDGHLSTTRARRGVLGTAVKYNAVFQ